MPPLKKHLEHQEYPEQCKRVRKPKPATLAILAYCELNDLNLYADYAATMEDFVAKHYGADIMPDGSRTLAHSRTIAKFIWEHYQKPFLKVKHLDPWLKCELKEWLRSRPGRVYQSDLELIRDHMPIQGSAHFLFVLQYVLKRRKQMGEHLRPSPRLGLASRRRQKANALEGGSMSQDV